MNITAKEFFKERDLNLKMKYDSGNVMRLMEAYKDHCDKAENLPISNVSVPLELDGMTIDKVDDRGHYWYHMSAISSFLTESEMIKLRHWIDDQLNER